MYPVKGFEHRRKTWSNNVYNQHVKNNLWNILDSSSTMNTKICPLRVLGGPAMIPLAALSIREKSPNSPRAFRTFGARGLAVYPIFVTPLLSTVFRKFVFLQAKPRISFHRRLWRQTRGNTARMIRLLLRMLRRVMRSRQNLRKEPPRA